MKARARMIGWEDLNEKKRAEITKAIYDEQKAAAWEKIARDNDGVIFYALVSEFGFDKKMCRRLFDAVFEARKEIGKRYDYMNDELAINDVAEIKLKSIGVDIDFWREKKKDWKPEEDKVWMRADE